MVAPESVSIRLLESLGTVRSENGHGVPLVRSIVRVTFKDNTGQAERQAAIDAIGGTVIGGTHFLPGEGDYWVRIPGTTLDSIMAAIVALRARPQVEDAFPVFVEPRPFAPDANGRVPMSR